MTLVPNADISRQRKPTILYRSHGIKLAKPAVPPRLASMTRPVADQGRRIFQPEPLAPLTELCPPRATAAVTPGGLTVIGREVSLAVSPAELESVSADLGSSPTEYMDFPLSTVQGVEEAARRKEFVLELDDMTQFANYASDVMEAAGFPRAGETNSFIRMYLQSPEKIKVRGSVSHPVRGETDKTPYDNLALLLIPKMWEKYNGDQKRQLLRALLMLFEYTDNPGEINAGRLMIRLGEILERTEDRAQRELIYSLMEICRDKLPREARGALLRTIVKHKEYGASVASYLLMGAKEEGGGRH